MPSLEPKKPSAGAAGSSPSTSARHAKGGTLPASDSARRYSHPHPDPAHIVFVYRYYVLEWKAKMNRPLVARGKLPSRRAARGLIHYLDLVQEYIAAKALMLSQGKSTAQVRAAFGRKSSHRL